MPKPGERARYRPMPRDFVEVYVRDGFNGACAHFQAHKRNVQQWINDNGGVELVHRRIMHLSSVGRRATVNRMLAQRIRRRNVLAAREACQNLPENGSPANERMI